jgi:hypothetical protein
LHSPIVGDPSVRVLGDVEIDPDEDPPTMDRR